MGCIVKPKVRRYAKLFQKWLSLNSNWLWNEENKHKSANNMLILLQICIFPIYQRGHGPRIWDRWFSQNKDTYYSFKYFFLEKNLVKKFKANIGQMLLSLLRKKCLRFFIKNIWQKKFSYEITKRQHFKSNQTQDYIN